jgi:hypothetical protein
MTNSPPPTAPRRTWFTILVGVVAILFGGVGSLFSAFALLLAIGKPYANSTSDPLGIFLIFILPPGTLLAGIGLLLRWRAARWWMILLMAGIMAFGVKSLVAPSYQKNPKYYSDSLKQYLIVQSIACIAVGGIALLGLLSRPVRREFSTTPSTPMRTNETTWRVGHTGRDMMYYEETHNGQTQRINIDGEMLTGRAHHVIYFADDETWQRYPEWARHRRDEIIARIKSQFREPDYEYAGGGTASTSANALIPTAPPRLPSNDGTILPMLAFLIFIACACFWFAACGLDRGEIRLPVKQGSASHIVTRAEKPALFWTSLGTLAVLGTGSVGFGVWLLAAHRSPPKTP